MGNAVIEDNNCVGVFVFEDALSRDEIVDDLVVVVVDYVGGWEN